MKRSLGASLGFILKVGLAAMVFFIFAKWLARKVNVPGLTTAVEAA
jgi:hypothetical protein